MFTAADCDDVSSRIFVDRHGRDLALSPAKVAKRSSGFGDGY